MAQYTIGSYGEMDGKRTLCRNNDGSLNIVRNAETDDADVVLQVPRVHAVKRSERWSAPDFDQEAFAQRVCDLLNTDEAANAA